MKKIGPKSEYFIPKKLFKNVNISFHKVEESWSLLGRVGRGAVQTGGASCGLQQVPGAHSDQAASTTGCQHLIQRPEDSVYWRGGELYTDDSDPAEALVQWAPHLSEPPGKHK